MNSTQTDELFNDPGKLLQLIVAAEGTKGHGGGSGNGSGSGGGAGAGNGAGSGPGSDGAAHAEAGAGPGGVPSGDDGTGFLPPPPSDGATGGRWATATTGIRSTRSARGSHGSMPVETGLMTLHEDELQGILQVLAQIARTNEGSKEKMDATAFQSRLSTLPRRAKFTVSQALSALAAQAPSESSDKPTLLKLAENIAIRFALEKYQNGDVQVDAVRQMLDEMSTELNGLRKILGVYEEKMTRAGIEVPSHVEALAQEFWANIPDDKKKVTLESKDAWCVPAAKAREYIDGLISRGEKEDAEKILSNYASCIANESSEIRRQTAMGLADLAPLYAKVDERILVNTIRQVGVQLAEERDSELQSLVGAAFVRLSQEGADKRSYRAIQRSVELIDYVESERPGVGKSLRPRIAIENRLPEFIEESLKLDEIPAGLKDVIRRLPEPSAELIAGRFGRAGFREDCETLVTLMGVLGVEGVAHLREKLIHGDPAQATSTVGILARVDFETLEKVLPDRMKEWKRTAHDRVVRQIAASGAPQGGRLLLQLFDHLDPLIRPIAVDEIGMSGEQGADKLLLRIAEGDLPKGGTDYLRLKAVEALGRLKAPGSDVILRKIAESRRAWRWANPSELRLVAAQAMAKIDPDWLNAFLAKSGLDLQDLSIEILDTDPSSSAIRQRRYSRLRLERPMTATTTNLRENHRLEIPEMALGGGVAICEQNLHPGSVVDLRLTVGQKTVKAQTIVRDANTQARAFEVVEMDLEERSKLRKILVQLGNALKQSTSKERVRRGNRTILFPNI